MLEQRVLDDDTEAEGHEDRRQRVGAHHPVEDEALQHVAADGEARNDQEERDERVHVEGGGRRHRQEGRQDRQVAVRQVDEAHDAEGERQARGEQGEQPTEQDPLDHGVDPSHDVGPEVRLGDPEAVEVARPALERHPALEEAHDAVGHCEGLTDVLFHDQHGRPPGDHGGQRGVELLDDDRRQAERHLVEQQEAGVGHQRPADGDGLALAPRQHVGGAPQQRPHEREHVEHPIDVPPTGAPRVAADQQVLLHGEAGEQAAALGHEGDAPADPPVARHTRAGPPPRSARCPRMSARGRPRCSTGWTCPPRWRR